MKSSYKYWCCGRPYKTLAGAKRAAAAVFRDTGIVVAIESFLLPEPVTVA